MIGSKISVAVADAKGNKDVSDETAPVAVYEALEILDAEQKGAKAIEATFSEAITALDKLTVSKNGEELKQAYAPKIADDGLSATITLENRITAGTYTVTLTPADADEDPSSATFEGEVAALNSIEFVTDNLIMKDNEYKEGYAYIKGVDQFGDNMSLSSVTVIPGYGHFRSYDATTGKITIGVDDDETNFAIVKEVPVFVTYQNGADTIPANATLKVTTMSYVQDLTFGDIYKADGSKVDDDTNPLMIGDLKSKPYVEIKDVEDQYGNKLSAKDLNDQANGNTKVLFVIPDESTTSAYYSTGKFSTITEKDGTVKTILYLAAGGDMPGSMDLIITGASGQSFSKPVTVQDDPYIDTLRVNYPTLYEGTDESDALEFTAVDQYGKEIDNLFKYAPKVEGKNLIFGDMNHQTNKYTNIAAPDGVNWVVKKDNLKKKFTVSIKLDPNVEKGQTLVMMATTAGLKVTPTNLTVGQRTNGESIDTTIGGNLALDPQTTEFDFNQNVRFLSSNGTVMDRIENEQYPIFLKDATTAGDAKDTYDAVTPTKDKPVFFWTVSLGKEGTVTGNKKNGFVIKPSDGSEFDTDGVITVGELDAANKANGATDDTVETVKGAKVYKAHKNATYYVTLYKASKDSSDELNVAVIDKQSFKLTYSPTIVDGAWQLGKRYTAEVVDPITKENRSVYADGEDYVKLRVKAEPNIGEPYYVADDFIQVTGNTSAIKCNPNTLKVTASDAGKATFRVYVKEPGDDRGVYTEVKVEADETQTATKNQKDFAATKVNAGQLNSKVGNDFTDSSTEDTTEWSTKSAETVNAANPQDRKVSVVKIADGKMTITYGNRLGETLTLGIKDQHNLNMTNAKFYVDGKPYEEFWEGITPETQADPDNEVKQTTNNKVKRIIEVRSADDTKIEDYTIELGKTEWYYTATKKTAAATVYNESQLRKAFTKGVNDTVTLGKDIDLTANFGDKQWSDVNYIETGDTLIIPAEYALYIGDNTLDVDGNLEISGLVCGGTKAAPDKTKGKVQGDGTATIKDGGTLSVGTADLRQPHTLHVNKGGTLIVGTLGGYVVAEDNIVAGTISAGTNITINEGLDISATDGALPTSINNASITIKPTSASSTSASIKLGGETVSSTGNKASDGTFKIDTDTAETKVQHNYETSAGPVIEKITALKTESTQSDLTSSDACNIEIGNIAEARSAYAGLSSGAKAVVKEADDVKTLLPDSVEPGEDKVIVYLDSRKEAVKAIYDAATELESVKANNLEVTGLVYNKTDTGAQSDASKLAADKEAAGTALEAKLGTIIGGMTFAKCTEVSVDSVSINNDFTAGTNVDAGTYTCTVTLTCIEGVVYTIENVRVTNGTLKTE